MPRKKSAKDSQLDPWGSGLVESYERAMEQFGIESFDSEMFPKPNRIMRRGGVFGGRDLKRIAQCIKEKKPFYALTGIMPSADKIHLGNKMVVENLSYFQQQGANTYILVADLECAATRGVTLEEAQKRAREFHIPAYIALGLDPKKTTFYFQSENRKVMNLAYEFSTKITLNEFKAIYGSGDPSRIMAAVTQIGDILFPQLEQRMPGIIPVGVDQDPHIRLTRDVVARVKSKYGFVPPSAIYNKFTPSLDGSMKMSKSKPQSCVSLPEDPLAVCRKLKRAMSGGRITLEEHRKKGGMPDKDMVYQLLRFHLLDDDNKLRRIHDEYTSGEMTTGELKRIGCDEMTRFMHDFTDRLEKSRDSIYSLNFLQFS